MHRHPEGQLSHMINSWPKDSGLGQKNRKALTHNQGLLVLTQTRYSTRYAGLEDRGSSKINQNRRFWNLRNWAHS